MPRQYTPRVAVICTRCGDDFTVTPSRFKDGRGKFCGTECQYPEPTEERFWELVNKNGPTPSHVPHLGPCWIWTAGRHGSGYGVFRFNGRQVDAHVVAYILTTGHKAPPETPWILHHCDGGAIGCVRPSHLYAGTSKQNVSDALERNRASTGEAHGVAIRRAGAVGVRHRSRTRPESVKRGSRQWKALLTDDQVRESRQRYALGGITIRELAVACGVARQTMSKVLSRKSWTHI